MDRFPKWQEPVDEVVLPSLKARPRHLFQQGLLVNLTNPKILWIAALVPQFIDMEKPLAIQYLIYPLALCMTDIMVMSIYAISRCPFRGWLRQPKARAIQNPTFWKHVCGGRSISGDGKVIGNQESSQMYVAIVVLLASK